MVIIKVRNTGKKSEPGITMGSANRIKTVIRKAFKGQVDRPNISTNTADGTITISNFDGENSETMKNLVRRALTGASRRARVKFEIIVIDEEE